MASEASRGSQKPPEALRSPQRLKTASEASQRPLGALGDLKTVPKTRQGSRKRPEAQNCQKWQN